MVSFATTRHGEAGGCSQVTQRLEFHLLLTSAISSSHLFSCVSFWATETCRNQITVSIHQMTKINFKDLNHRVIRHVAVTIAIFTASHQATSRAPQTVTFRPLRPQTKQTNNLPFCRSRGHRARACSGPPERCASDANARGARPVSFPRMSVKPVCTRPYLFLLMGRELINLTGKTTVLLDSNAFRNELV